MQSKEYWYMRSASTRGFANKRDGCVCVFDFLGPKYGNDKWTLYKEAEFFILPTYSENYGIVVPEALASGTPVRLLHMVHLGRNLIVKNVEHRFL